MTRTLVCTLALLPALAGCIPTSISTRVFEPIRPRQPLNATVLAVMPGVSEPGSEWIRPETMDGLVQGLADRFPELWVVGPDDAAGALSAQSLAAEYAALLDDFERARVVDAERVDRVLDALGATHFLHVRASYLSDRRDKTTWDLDGDVQHYQAKRQTFEVVARLWQTGVTAPTWEAVARSESERGWLTRDRDPSELVESLVASVVEAIPLEGATPAPER